MMRLLVVFCAAGLLSAQTLSAPVAGVILGNDGRLLSIAGVPGNLLPGRTIPGVAGGQQILSAGFSSQTGALKTESQLILADGSGVFQSSREAPSGTALFAFDPHGALQWICFPDAHQLQSVTGTVVLDTSGWGDSVVALGSIKGNSIGALVLRGSQLWAETVATDPGTISSQIPIAGAAPAAFFEGGWLTVGVTGLSWQPMTGAAVSHPIALPAAAATLQTAGAHSVAINGHWLLSPDWQVSEIPSSPRTRAADRVEPPAGKLR